MNTSILTEFSRRNFFEMMKDVATSIPGHVIAFDPVTQHAQIQIGIVRKDVKGVEFNPPPIIEVPVYFAGGNFSIEYQIDPLNEGFILFSQRCIDGWKTTGGISKNPIMRFHDMSDAVFFPGVRSQPNVLSNFANNGIRLRNLYGNHHVWIKNDGTIKLTNDVSTCTMFPNGTNSITNGSGNITMSPDGTINMNGFIITPSGAASSPVSVSAPTVVAATSLTVAGKEQSGHTHTAGGYNITGTPVTGNSGAQP